MIFGKHFSFFVRTALAGAILSAFATGCANYKLGANAPVPFSTVQILPIQNDTYAPQIQPLLHQQIAETLAQEGQLRLMTSGAQSSLTVKITNYDETIAATRSDDTVLGSSYILTLTARCTLADNRTGKIYFQDREIRATADVQTMGGHATAEYQTMPLLTRELARKIRDNITGVW